jgi:hypothetical protein
MVSYIQRKHNSIFSNFMNFLVHKLITYTILTKTVSNKYWKQESKIKLNGPKLPCQAGITSADRSRPPLA